jgi:hypothetical protein
MLKRSLMVAAFLMSACVTVNIYFPAAAVERAADQIVKETWGGPAEPQPQKGQPQSSLPRENGGTRLAFSFINQALAQEADINVSNPAIRALKDSIKNRSDAIKPFMDKGNIGIDQDGLLAIRSSDGLNLQERAETKQLIEAAVGEAGDGGHPLFVERLELGVGGESLGFGLRHGVFALQLRDFVGAFGDLIVGRDEGGGAEFTIHLPRNHQPARAA